MNIYASPGLCVLYCRTNPVTLFIKYTFHCMVMLYCNTAGDIFGSVYSWVTQFSVTLVMFWCIYENPDSKVHGAKMGPTWILSAPDGPHVGPMNLANGEAYRGPVGERECLRKDIHMRCPLIRVPLVLRCLILLATQLYVKKSLITQKSSNLYIRVPLYWNSVWNPLVTDGYLHKEPIILNTCLFHDFIILSSVAEWEGFQRRHPWQARIASVYWLPCVSSLLLSLLLSLSWRNGTN